MAWILNENEIQALLDAPAEKRYKYFLNHVAGMQELWSLKNESGWVLCGDKDGQIIIPVWPHRFYAQKCSVGEWKGCEPQSISTTDWLMKWTPGMIKDKRVVAVFPIPSGKGVIVNPAYLEKDLKEELSQYE